MFAKAYSIVRNFTFPIIISHRTYDGKCASGIGTFIVINDEGWFITAFHIMQQIQQLAEANKTYKALVTERKKIEDDKTLLQQMIKAKLKNLKIEPTHITNFSIFPGLLGTRIIGTTHVIPAADIAIGKLDGFDKTLVKEYPRFKDPARPMEQGTSLCKIGFPFHVIQPTFENERFNLPPGALPVPLFPIEGIYTRQIEVKSDVPMKFPIKFVETSSPGLRGQSGGPTFDVQGTIWAIQSQTRHFPLGFGSNQKHSKNAEHLKHQYLNVGWGTHSETIVNLLKEKNINFHLSDY